MVDEMTLGPHTHEVLDVLHLAQSGRIFTEGAPPSGVRVLIIPELSQAKEFEPRKEGDRGWDDIRGLAAEDYWARRPAFVKNLTRGGALEKLGQELARIISSKLRGRLPEEHVDSIANDFYSCAAERAAFGARPGFWEDLLAIYASGGYPCAWAGPYPDGTFVVYYPRRTDTIT